MTTDAFRMKPQIEQRHLGHRIWVQYQPEGHKHRAQLRCRDCNAWLKWLSVGQAEEICRVLGDPDL
jgi:hypothetical protein